MYNYHLCISSNTLFTNNNWYLRQEEKQISGSSGAVGEEAFIATVSNADCAVAKRLVIPFSLKFAYQQYPQDCCYLFHHRHSRYQLDKSIPVFEGIFLLSTIILITLFGHAVLMTAIILPSSCSLDLTERFQSGFYVNMTLYQLSWQDHWTYNAHCLI